MTKPKTVQDAKAHLSENPRGAAVATRNVRAFEPLGVALVDPWSD
jgi:hypothetical protein